MGTKPCLKLGTLLLAGLLVTGCDSTQRSGGLTKSSTPSPTWPGSSSSGTYVNGQPSSSGFNTGATGQNGYGRGGTAATNIQPGFGGTSAQTSGNGLSQPNFGTGTQPTTNTFGTTPASNAIPPASNSNSSQFGTTNNPGIAPVGTGGSPSLPNGYGSPSPGIPSPLR